jgi:HAD superfamily hydrolase (TIGR01509 family)
MIKAVIFDMDGVLVDSEAYHERYLTRVCLNLGIHIKKKDFEALRGTTAEHFWEHISEIYSLKKITPTFIENVKIGYLDFLKSLETIKPIDGVIELLELLESLAIRKVVASSASRIRVDALIEMLGISKYFAQKISGQDVEKGKPSPDIFLISAQKIGSRVEECIVIEDSPNGIAAAKAAGMKCIGFSGSGTKAETLSNSDLVISNFNEITRSIKSKKSLNHLFR